MSTGYCSIESVPDVLLKSHECKKTSCSRCLFGALAKSKRCAPGRKSSCCAFLCRQVAEEQRAESNLNQMITENRVPSANQDVYFWRTANVSEICTENVAAKEIHKILEKDSLDVNKLLRTESYLKAYLAFQKFEEIPAIETSILQVAQFEANIACSIHSLHDNTESIERSRISKSAVGDVGRETLLHQKSLIEKQSCWRSSD